MYTSLQTSENKDNYVEEYKAVLKNGFSYEGGKVIEAYYNVKRDLVHSQYRWLHFAACIYEKGIIYLE